MPTVKLERKALEKRIGKKLSEDELKEAITYLGTDLESLGAEEIDVEIFPNRPDLLSEQGLGRALATFVGNDKGLKKYSAKKSGEKVIVEKSVKDVRPFTSCAIVKNLDLDDEKIREIIQIQEKLHITYGRNRKKCAIGIYPLEKIKFPITFSAEDPKKVKFLPLESTKEMTGLQVLSQHPTGREYGQLLEGLNKFPFFIDANNKILSMPPIINSHDVGKVSEETKNVFIECSGFDQKVLDICLNMVVTSLSEMGGEIYSVELENKHSNWKKESPNLNPSKMKIDLNYVNKILGLDLEKKEIKVLLEKMGFDYSNKEVSVPCYRADILHQIDFIEDIAIAYGYKKFKDEIPNCATVGSRNCVESFKIKVAEVLSGLGLFETNTYCLISSDALEGKKVRLANSVTEGYDCLRNEIIPSLMSVLKTNRNRDYPQGFFEVGITFSPNEKEESKISEGRELGFIYADKKADYTYARQVLDYLLNNLDVDYEIKSPKKNSKYMEGRFGDVVVKGKVIGQVGSINPKELEKSELEIPVCAFNIDFLELARLIIQ